MPIDIFGRSSESQKTVSVVKGVSLEYILSNYIRKAVLIQMEKDIKHLEDSILKLAEQNDKLHHSVKKNNKHYVTVWAEESGSLVKGKHEFSFGDSMTGRSSRYTVLANSKVIKMGMSVSSASIIPDKTGVFIVVNDSKTQCVISKPAGVFSHVIDIPSLLLKPGDIISFMTEASTSNM